MAAMSSVTTVTTLSTLSMLSALSALSFAIVFATRCALADVGHGTTLTARRDEGQKVTLVRPARPADDQPRACRAYAPQLACV